jgi:hypothetical protein
MNAPDISQDEADFIRSYAAEATAAFGEEFKDNRSRFKGFEKLLARFADAVASMLSNGRHLIAGVDEAHNELCVGSQLLANGARRFVSLEYEPPLSGSLKSIDFRAETDEGQVFQVDVKTIRPRVNDRWDQFEKAREEDWFPANVQVGLSEHWLGGELWHNMFAARSRMLEYALQLEAKIRDCALGEARENFFILMFGGEGFHWREDELEDFVSFYRTGTHRLDDPLSKAEAKYMADKNIRIDRTISRFACLARSQFEIRERRLNWNVQPPGNPH